MRLTVRACSDSATPKGLHNVSLTATSALMSSETSLILFKPDAVSKNLTGTVLARFEAQGFKVRGIKMMRLSDEILAEHYSHIADKPFFPSVRGFMQETPVIALALEGENVIARVRDLLGPTDSVVAPTGTIRGDFGFKDADAKMRNVCHASDSVEAAAAEIKRFFNEDEIFAY
jgi:nucleoside-diphosphate kinase